MDYFADEFGFNSTEVVALLGVHTMGSAFVANSGFSVCFTLLKNAFTSLIRQPFYFMYRSMEDRKIPIKKRFHAFGKNKKGEIITLLT